MVNRKAVKYSHTACMRILQLCYLCMYQEKSHQDSSFNQHYQMHPYYVHLKGRWINIFSRTYVVMILALESFCQGSYLSCPQQSNWEKVCCPKLQSCSITSLVSQTEMIVGQCSGLDMGFRMPADSFSENKTTNLTKLGFTKLLSLPVNGC